MKATRTRQIRSSTPAKPPRWAELTAGADKKPCHRNCRLQTTGCGSRTTEAGSLTTPGALTWHRLSQNRWAKHKRKGRQGTPETLSTYGVLRVQLLQHGLVGAFRKAAFFVDERNQPHVFFNQVQTLAVVSPLHFAPVDTLPVETLGGDKGKKRTEQPQLRLPNT